MKYTEKIGNDFLTYEGKDLKNTAPSSFFELIFMVIGTIIMFFILFGLFVLGCAVLGWILNFIF
nr:hypothetical protein [Clostridia bacterium]